MKFIKVGDQHINMDQVHSVDSRVEAGAMSGIYLYTSNHTVRITDPAEQEQVLRWLERNSADVMTQLG
jgi:hypothetical protein